MIFNTRRRVESRTISGERIALETVAGETPAILATSSMVIWPMRVLSNKMMTLTFIIRPILPGQEKFGF
jgi:hypothetical protein